MNRTRLAEMASAGVLDDDELTAAADSIEHTCYLNGGVSCWQCERQERIAEAQDDALGQARALLGKVKSGEHDRCCDHACPFCGGKGGCETCDQIHIDAADQDLRAVGLVLAAMSA